MSHLNESKIARLHRLSEWNQNELSQFVGVSRVSVNHWLQGKTNPEGVKLMLITLAVMVAERSPELLRASFDVEMPRDALASVARFLGRDAGLHYWLGLQSPYNLVDVKDTVPMRRLAVLLDLIAVMMPDMRVRMCERFDAGVESARDARAEKIRLSDARTKEKRADWVKNRRRLAKPGD